MAGAHSYTNLEVEMPPEEPQVEPQVGGLRYRKVAAMGLVALAGVVALAVCGWKPQDGPLLRADGSGLVGLSQDCSPTNQACQQTGCCSTKGDECYAMNPHYAQCQAQQVILTTTTAKEKKENCTQATPGAAGNCMNTKWCCNDKLACIQKSDNYANCEVAMTTYKTEQKEEKVASEEEQKDEKKHQKEVQKEQNEDEKEDEEEEKQS